MSNENAYTYNPADIERKWQDYWDEHQSFKTADDFSKPKYYVLDMFPYPSGAGLHVGHPEGYTATDIVARYKRMKGFNVLHPMGWDAFGLPAERAAMREGRHPAEITKENVTNFKRQIKSIGLSYDWTREVNTSTEDYYKWTQWIFLKLYEKGLAYLADVPVNWCPAQGTVLANEEVQDGVYIETGDPVERRIMKQWMLKITVYAEKLIEGLEGLDWPPGILEMQRQWIGKSEGATIHFAIDGHKGKSIEVFTTRPDTLFGATYCALAPEHELVDTITTAEQKAEVAKYIEEFKNKSDREIEAGAAKNKTGVFTGAYAINPVNNKKVPVWITDYVKKDYGSGAIMAVPAHDQRDYDFAKKFGVEIIEVVKGGDISNEAFTEEGVVVNSDFLNGLKTEEAKTKMLNWLDEKKIGERKVTYKLRDWLFSRQRYWGEPFPIMHSKDGKKIVPVAEKDLPLTLPNIEEYKPTADGNPPLSRATDWVNVNLNGEDMVRETNTMPQWAGSCWYYLRYMDPNNDKQAWSKEAEKYWGQVDLYVGGVEHAVLHLLYARFWHKVLFDCGLVSTSEPFKKLFNQGMILGISYQDSKGKYYHPSQVEQRGDKFYVTGTDTILTTKEEKMSKSKLNVENPDDVINAYGADSLRLYEMFMGPLEAVKPWQTNGVKGVRGFLDRAWSLVVDRETNAVSSLISGDENSASPALLKELHLTIQKVTDDIENLRFNTGIAKMMEFVNVAKKETVIPKSVMEKFLIVLSPYAPHLAEELWNRLGHKQSITKEQWPVADAQYLVETTVVMTVHINGKRKAEITLDKGLDKDAIIALAKKEPNVSRFLNDNEIKKTIFVPEKLVNFII